MKTDIIYTAIKDRLNAQESEFTDNSLTPISKVIIYNKEYEKALEDNPTDDHPLPVRPYASIEFGESPITYKSGKKKALIQVTLHVVQDLYVDGREGAETESDYLALLSYHEKFTEVLEGIDAAGGKLKHINTIPDHDHANLLVYKHVFQVEVAKKNVGL